jgi:ribosomal protein S18 acetylase RimI-like enzyme
MTQFIVRRLAIQDTETYRDIRLHGLLHDPLAFTGCHDEESMMPPADFGDRIGEPQGLSAIFGTFLMTTGEMIGTVALDVPTAVKLRHKATLWGMYTLPSARGLGAGRAMMAHLVGYARQIGIERVLLVVTATNVARHWYEQEGFRLYGVERHAVKTSLSYEDDELRVLEL